MRYSTIAFLLFTLAAITLASSERITIRRKLKRDVPIAGTVNVDTTETQGKNTVSSQGVLKSGGPVDTPESKGKDVVSSQDILKSGDHTDTGVSTKDQGRTVAREISGTLPVREQEQKKSNGPVDVNSEASSGGIQKQAIVSTPAEGDQTQENSKGSPDTSVEEKPAAVEGLPSTTEEVPAAEENPVVPGKEKASIQGDVTNPVIDQATIANGNITVPPISIVAPV